MHNIRITLEIRSFIFHALFFAAIFTHTTISYSFADIYAYRERVEFSNLCSVHILRELGTEVIIIEHWHLHICGSVFWWGTSVLWTESSHIVLNIDNKLSWKNYINYIVTKLSSSCFIMRAMKPLMWLRSLRMIYFAYIHSIITWDYFLG
jgi:hypothetical protein